MGVWGRVGEQRLVVLWFMYIYMHMYSAMSRMMYRYGKRHDGM